MFNSERLSYTSKELETATGVSIKRWRDFRDLHLITTSIIGKREIWVVADVMKILEWAKGKTLNNKQDIINEMSKEENEIKKKSTKRIDRSSPHIR